MSWGGWVVQVMPGSRDNEGQEGQGQAAGQTGEQDPGQAGCVTWKPGRLEKGAALD